MSLTLKKIVFAITYNFLLFFLLMIGIQNSSNKRKINFFILETIKLPVSFIIGTSFISGSIIGSISNITFTKKN